MRFGINLRGDLAKLDDAEIASRYEALISETEAKRQAMPRYTKGLLFGRGLFHASIFYQIQALFIFAAFQPNLYTRSDIELYLLDCELKDTTDEIKRRVRHQKTAMATS